ncbi:hypothetical protein IWT25_00009 [Secundilactobacillus pentosiphilus]|uniref:DUF7671 domain-containing protein n=1 Tax=Secundilactobacillus pentosiphilus TaxID=1714682 RepID=A0A1Z5ISP8_9LACO|nr:hypothetical protein [Secundilactobacillus pentosiphilus]GAX04716.1 hypothetical protein IWT25_00009 [Secundilactobacillus pentosiphilus]
MAKAKYPVEEYIGVPVEQDDSGQYVIRDERDFQLHSWRTGRHTKGKLKRIGQVFLTENHLTVAVIATKPVAYKDRHAITPMQRFTSEFVSDDLIQLAKTKLK